MKSMTLFAAALLSCCIVTAARAADWPTLSKQETAVINAGLKNAPPAALTIACAGQWCRVLADDFAGLFVAAKWKVTRMNQGGLGIDGVSGLRLHSCGLSETKIDDVIKQLAARKVEVIDEGRCLGSREIFLIIGAVPN